MDPFSVALGVVTLLQVSTECAGKLQGLISEYKSAPDEILALNNEVVDFQKVLLQHKETADGITVLSDAAKKSTADLFDRAQSIIDGVEELLDHFTIKKQKGKVALFAAWKTKRNRVVLAKDELRRLKGDLGAFFVAETTKSSSRIETKLESISVQIGTVQTQLLLSSKQGDDLADEMREQSRNMSALLQTQSDIYTKQTHLETASQQSRCEISDKLSLQLATLSTVSQTQNEFGAKQDRFIMAAEKNQNQIENTMKVNQEQLMAVLSTLVAQNPAFNAIGGGKASQDHQLPASYSSEWSAESNYFSMTVSSSQSRVSVCKLECGCRCHKKTSLGTPSALKTFLGSLAIGYTGTILPWRQSCDRKDCGRKRKDSRFTYFFPRWWTTRVISFSMSVTGSSFMEMSAMNTCAIPADEKVTVHFQDDSSTVGAYELAQDFPHWFLRLARSREWSIHQQTVFEDGRTEPLLKAMFGLPRNRRNTKLIGSLMDLNPDLSFPAGDRAENSSLGAYLGDLWLFPEVPDVVRTVDSVELNEQVDLDPVFDEMEATAGHRMSLMEVGTKVRKVFMGEPRLLESRDAKGRTPLHWGCRNVNVTYVDELIHLGADVNARSEEGFVPLHFLFMQLQYSNTTYKGIRKNVDQMFHDVCKVIDLLAAAGADLNAVDDTGHSKVIEFFVNSGYVAFTKELKVLLLDKLCDLGMDINLGVGRPSSCPLFLEGWRLEPFGDFVDDQYLLSIEMLFAGLKRGLIYHVPNPDGETILFVIAEKLREWGYLTENGMIPPLSSFSLPKLETRHVSSRKGVDVRGYLARQVARKKLSTASRGYNEFLEALDKIDCDHATYIRGSSQRPQMKTEGEISGDFVEDLGDMNDDDDDFQDALEVL